MLSSSSPPLAPGLPTHSLSGFSRREAGLGPAHGAFRMGQAPTGAARGAPTLPTGRGSSDTLQVFQPAERKARGKHIPSLLVLFVTSAGPIHRRDEPCFSRCSAGAGQRAQSTAASPRRWEGVSPASRGRASPPSQLMAPSSPGRRSSLGPRHGVPARRRQRHSAHTISLSSPRCPGSRPSPAARPCPARRGAGPGSPVLAGRDDAVLLGDEERGAHGVLVPLDLAEQDGPAALRPRVDLGGHGP